MRHTKTYSLSCLARRRMATLLCGDRLAVMVLLTGLLCFSGCGVTRLGGSAVPTLPRSGTPPVATPGVPPARPLVWRSALLPGSQLPSLAGGFIRLGPTVGVAPNDSATAYACAPAKGASNTGVATWLTQNRGASWQPGGGITVNVGSPIEVTGCQIMVDATEAGTAVAQIGLLPGGGCMPAVDCGTYALYLSTDMGRHWAPLASLRNPQSGQSPSEPLDTLDPLATYQQTTYALFRSAPRSASTQDVSFVMSRDGMHTWRPVPGLDLVRHEITDFWLNPYNGALLVMTSSSLYDQETFLTSVNSGGSWSTVPAPPFPFAFYDIAVQQPFTDQPWHICGGDTASVIESGVQQNTHLDDVACTADSGIHWVTHHLNLPKNAGSGPFAGPLYTLIGIADDGSLLLNTSFVLVRVISGVAGTQALGPLPNAGLVFYASGDGSGMLWSAPQGGYTDPQNRIFTASYS